MGRARAAGWSEGAAGFLRVQLSGALSVVLPPVSGAWKV